MKRITTKDNQNRRTIKPFSKKDPPFRITVSQRITVVETGEIYLLVEIYSPNGKITTHSLLRSEVLGYQPKKLIDLGVDIPSDREGRKNFEDYIRSEEEKAISNYMHIGLGWSTQDDIASAPEVARYFKGYEAIGFKSVYSGSFQIKPHGTINGWISIVNEHVMPYIELQFVLLAGMAPVLLGYLYTEIAESLLIHLYGISSTGKTTALFTSMSCSCKPDRRKSLMTQWSSTFNALYGLANGNFGYPILIDELSGNDKSDLSEFVYNLVNGAGKDRMTSSLVLREKESWGTVFISSGETSLLSKCNKNAGLNVRVIEMNFSKITRSATHAEALNRGFSEHYGHANPLLAEYILKHDYATILQKYENERKLIVDAFIKKDNFTERISKKFAVIMLTATIAKEIFNLNFDKDAIRQLLINSCIEQSEQHSRNLLENVLQALTTHLAGNEKQYIHCYEKQSTKIQSTSYAAGMIYHLSQEKMLGNEKCYVEILYLPDQFRKIMYSAGIPDSRLALEALREKGYLSADAGKLTRKRTINGAKPRVHVIMLPESYYHPSDEMLMEL